MDSQNINSIEQCYRLLAICAHTTTHEAMHEALQENLKTFTAWDELPKQAELHGMATLLFYHLQKFNIPIPSETKKILQGLHFRHRAFSNAHTQALLEITSLLAQKNIRAVVLKGLALAYEYYPDPTLRPISDIDLLLNQEDILPTVDILTQAGYRSQTTLPPNPKLLPKELTFYSPTKDGMSTHIEIHHHNPFAKSIVDNSSDDEFIGFEAEPHPIKIGEQEVYVPDPINHLEYLLRHLTRHMFVSTNEKPLLLKWLVDVIAIVEEHAQIINWENNKQLLNQLEVMYSLTPLPEHISKYIPIRKIQPPQGVNQYPQGWPQQVYTNWKHKGLFHYLTKTFLSPRYIWHTLSAPSTWWLRLQYGIDSKSVFWYGQVVYRLQILRMAFSKVARNKN